MTSSGALTTLYNFCQRLGCADGYWPFAGVVQGSDGNFYGTTYFGGTGGGGANSPCPGDCGTIFRLTPSGTLTTLYNFCSQSFCTDGFTPSSPLVQGTDGNFYGTTQFGGPTTAGTVFKITPSGALTVLYSFCSQLHCDDGYGAPAGLLQVTDGSFYGATQYGGVYDGGTIFRITPSGIFTVLYSFCSQPNCADGENPVGLVQATNGNVYGTTRGGGIYTGSCGFGGAGGCGTVFSLSGPTPIPFQLIPVTPCRVVDTRNPNGTFGGPPIGSGTYRIFPIPQGTCNVPATAAAYSLNVTVAPHQPLGYLTIWPTGQNQPYVSTMNSPDGRTKANAAIVPAGGNGAVSVYATDTTDVILDIDGYFAPPGSGTYQFYTLPPCRIVDTRQNQDGGTLRAGLERDYVIPGNCGVPTTATAYSLNVTVLPTAGGLDYLTVWPKGENQPYVSTLNDYTGTVVANAAIVPAGNENATAFYPHDNNTDLLVDINGYFAPAGTGGLSLYPVTPCRVLDTRTVNGGQPFQGVYNAPNGINVVGSPCAPPSSSQAFVFNATVVPSGVMPFLTLWPHGSGQPLVSTLNAYDGFITSNMAIVPSSDGSIDAYAAGLTQLILDISGYFAP